MTKSTLVMISWVRIARRKDVVFFVLLMFVRRSLASCSSLLANLTARGVGGGAGGGGCGEGRGGSGLTDFEKSLTADEGGGPGLLVAAAREMTLICGVRMERRCLRC